MKRVIVEKDGLYYICQAKTDYIFKCGKCLFGLIAGIERPSEIPNDCRRCGAKHHSTTWGRSYFDMQVFYSGV